MEKKTWKYFFLIGVFCLSGLFFLPVWKISMGIPQYPKEIAINIWINKIENDTEKALEIMNVLNHNIGMEKIDPESIPELSYFPWLLGVLMLLGLVASFRENKKIRISWSVLLCILLAIALMDFYRWQYDFGHNLSDDAPIQVEGGAFQPPFLGKKEVANFIVKSYPVTGIVFPILSVVITSFSIIKEK